MADNCGIDILILILIVLFTIFLMTFILNNKILQLPAPEIVIEVCENNKNLIKLNIWTLNQNENNLNKDIENLINKVARKYRVNFQLWTTNRK